MNEQLEMDDFLKGGENMQPVDNIMDKVETALSTTAGEVTGTMMDVLPLALGVMAVSWGVTKAVRFFKRAAA